MGYDKNCCQCKNLLNPPQCLAKSEHREPSFSESRYRPSTALLKNKQEVENIWYDIRTLNGSPGMIDKLNAIDVRGGTERWGGITLYAKAIAFLVQLAPSEILSYR